MRFDQIDNIWTVDVTTLSNVDQGQLYFERAKWIVAEILSDPTKRSVAIQGSRIRRSYLHRLIGCRAGALTENKHIRDLLKEADGTIARRAETRSPSRARLRSRVDAIESAVKNLRDIVALQEATISELRRELQESRGLPRRTTFRTRDVAALNACDRGENL
jgi:hypothetical protein